jgi:uncharacterized protein YjbI with pentapeptide repeats
MRQGDEIERNGRLGAFVFSIGTLRNQALLAAVRLLGLCENQAFAELDRYTRSRIEPICERAFSSTELAKACPGKRLVGAVIAARLSGIGVHYPLASPSGGHGLAVAVKNLLERHLGEVHNLVLEEVRLAGISAPEEIVRHAVAYQAHVEAARNVVNIRRLALDHHRLRRFGGDVIGQFIDEKLISTSLLRAAVGIFGAEAGSTFIFHPGEKRLCPWAMYRRVDAFTSTEYGEGVAGAIAKAFLEDSEENLNGVTLRRAPSGRIVGAVVRDYNVLDSRLKKSPYLQRARKFPSVLITVLQDGERLIGLVYLEAELGREFGIDDSASLAEMMSGKVLTMKEAQDSYDWNFRPYYRFGDFAGADIEEEVPLIGKDLTQATFRGTKMRKAQLEKAKLIGTIFDEADLQDASMQHADLAGASFVRSNLSGCRFDSANINRCTFAGANLSHSIFDGAKISECTFEGANLTGVVLDRLDLRRSRFSNAVMRGCTISRVDGIEERKWHGVDLSASYMDKGAWNALPAIVRSIHCGCVFDLETRSVFVS